MYSHIGVYHPELGQQAGKQTIKWKNIIGQTQYITGYIFEKKTLDTHNSAKYVYSIFASDYWAHCSNVDDFMGDIDRDDHNTNSDGKPGFHGVYTGKLINTANALPTDNSLLTFNVVFNLGTSGSYRSNQSIDIL